MKTQMNDKARTWMEIQDEPGIQLTEYDITAAPNDFNVLTITNFVDQGSVILPPYQRNYTWDKGRASKLIESLILGLPIPQLFLYEEARNRFAILDGQQRLLSIYFFRKKRFPRKTQRARLREIFAEEGGFSDKILSDDKLFEPFNIYLPAVGGEIRSSLHGLNYDTLGEYQNAFNLRTIRCVIIKQNEPKDDNSSVFEIFDRLNTGGVNLKPQEIRANLYYSEFYRLLYDLNKDARWRRLLGQPNRDEKLRDIELLLRAFAMLCYAREYQPSMTRFLNRFSSHAKKNYGPAKLGRLQGLFEAFMQATDNVDPALFRLTGRFSIAVFEAAFYAKCHNLWENTAEIKLKPMTAAELGRLSGALRESLQEGTAKRDHVLRRLEIASNTLPA